MTLTICQTPYHNDATLEKLGIMHNPLNISQLSEPTEVVAFSLHYNICSIVYIGAKQKVTPYGCFTNLWRILILVETTLKKLGSIAILTLRFLFLF